MLDGVLLPHLGVHGRTDDDRGARGQERGREKVVGDAVCVTADDARRGRRHHDHVCRLAETGVGNGLGSVEERRARRFGGQSREGEGGDESGGALGQDRHDISAGVDQTATHLDRLVGGDAAAHPEDDPPSFQVAHVPPST